MITLDQYFGSYCNHPDAIPGKWALAEIMLEKVNRLLDRAEAEGVKAPINEKTNSQISGTENGGFRPLDCSIGAPSSKHKQGRAVDIYDPGGFLDNWITDGVLEDFGLWRENPDDTLGWCHLQDQPPKSGRRTFKP